MLQQRLNELTEKFAAKYGEFALERIDGEEVEPQVIIDSLKSLPFLASRKMIVLRSLGKNKLASGQIEQIISSISKELDVIFYEPSADKRTSFYKTLKKHTEFEEHNELDSRQLAQWLSSEAQRRGGQLALSDASYLVEKVGQDQMLLASELQKLLIYDHQITRENIDLLVEPTPQGKIFELLEAAFSGRQAAALRLYDEQRAQKVEPQAILALVSWQLQLLALVKAGGNRPASKIAKDSGKSEFPLVKASRLAAKITDEKLKLMVEWALEIDWQGKTTALDMDEALKNYLISL